MNRSLALAITLAAAPLAALRGQGAPWDTVGSAYASPVNIQAVGPERAVATGDFTVVGDKADVVRGIRAALDAVR